MQTQLSQATAEALRACKALGDDLLFSHSTGVALLGIEEPAHSLDTTLLHGMVKSAKDRRHIQGATLHVWSNDDVRTYRAGSIRCADPLTVWAQMAPAIGDLGEFITFTESVLRRTTITIDQMNAYLDRSGRFPGKKLCADATKLALPGTQSPYETKAWLAVTIHGLPRPVAQHTVTELSFPNGAAVTLDFAYPTCRVGIEYQGDQHRTDKKQWRNDEWKHEALRTRRWIIITATALDLSDDFHRLNLAMRVAEAILAQTGVVIPLIPHMEPKALLDGRRKLLVPFAAPMRNAAGS